MRQRTQMLGPSEVAQRQTVIDDDIWSLGHHRNIAFETSLFKTAMSWLGTDCRSSTGNVSLVLTVRLGTDGGGEVGNGL